MLPAILSNLCFSFACLVPWPCKKDDSLVQKSQSTCLNRMDIRKKRTIPFQDKNPASAITFTTKPAIYKPLGQTSPPPYHFDITNSFYRFALAVADLFIVHPLHSIRNELINEPIRILPRTDYRLYLT